MIVSFIVKAFVLTIPFISLARKNKYRIDANQELIGIGKNNS